MNPIVVVTLIIVGIGAAYFFMISLGDAQYAAGNAPNGLLTTYGELAAKVIIVVLILYGIYYVIASFKSATRERKAKALRAQERARRGY